MVIPGHAKAFVKKTERDILLESGFVVKIALCCGGRDCGIQGFSDLGFRVQGLDFRF